MHNTFIIYFRLDQEDTRRVLVLVVSTWEMNVRIDTSIILAIVGDLSPSTPDYLSTSCNQTELANVDFDNCTFGQYTCRRLVCFQPLGLSVLT